MKETRYIISDAAKKLSVEPHVLRYWEEELDISIPRNDMGHRFYRESDIAIFESVKRLKEHNFHLRAIKVIMPDLMRVSKLDDSQLDELRFELETKTPQIAPAGTAVPAVSKPSSEAACSPSVKMEQFKQILSRIVTDALHNSSTEMTDKITNSVTENVSKEVDYMLRQKEEADEERYRSLDETIRAFQKARQETAASEMAEATSRRAKRRRPKKH
jgi:DNA-binding transcriptional MerR regulator